MMSYNEMVFYRKIRTHLADLHQKWIDDPNSDGHHKSNEGYVGIMFDAGNWFDCNGKQDYIDSELKITLVEVYSYLFGPSRLHEFSSLEEAWNEVKKWEYINEDNNF